MAASFREDLVLDMEPCSSVVEVLVHCSHNHFSFTKPCISIGQNWKIRRRRYLSNDLAELREIADPDVRDS